MSQHQSFLYQNCMVPWFCTSSDIQLIFHDAGLHNPTPVNVISHFCYFSPMAASAAVIAMVVSTYLHKTHPDYLPPMGLQYDNIVIFSGYNSYDNGGSRGGRWVLVHSSKWKQHNLFSHISMLISQRWLWQRWRKQWKRWLRRWVDR